MKKIRQVLNLDNKESRGSMTENNKPEGNEGPRSFLPIGIAVSVGVGIALGAALDNIAVGIAVGIGAGVVFGAALDARRRNSSNR